jgi:hypothetical protein
MALYWSSVAGEPVCVLEGDEDVDGGLEEVGELDNESDVNEEVVEVDKDDDDDIVEDSELIDATISKKNS